jgi:hypothetical protein
MGAGRSWSGIRPAWGNYLINAVGMVEVEPD